MSLVLILYTNSNPYNTFTKLNECLKCFLIIICLQIYKYILYKLCQSLSIDNQIMYEYVFPRKSQMFRSSLMIWDDFYWVWLCDGNMMDVSRKCFAQKGSNLRCFWRTCWNWEFLWIEPGTFRNKSQDT